MSETLGIASFIERSRRVPMLDVRTPDEYAKGHLPGAYNLPLFSNEERAEIGTLYKQAGREAAMLRGLDLAGPRLRRQAVCDGALADACRYLLVYYDTAYRHSLNKRNATKQHHIGLPTPPTPVAFADQLLETTLV